MKLFIRQIPRPGSSPVIIFLLLIFSIWQVTAQKIEKLEQWQNGDNHGEAGSWTTGALNPNNSHVSECMTIPYQLEISELTPGETYCVTISWDTKKGGKHAYDYITAYYTVGSHSDVYGGPDAIDILDGTGLDGQLGNVNVGTFVIPTPGTPGSQPYEIVDDLKNIDLSDFHFTAFNGQITNLDYSQGSMTQDDASDELTICFVPDDPAGTALDGIVVLAWGAHVASQEVWGLGNSAVDINGSPYHTQLIDCDCPCSTDNFGGGGCGQKDVAMQANAVCGATCQIIEVVNSNCNSQSNGSITIMVSGVGNSPSFTLNGNVANPTNNNDGTYTFEDLGPNLYVIEVSDGSGCSTTCEATISEPDEVTLTVSSTNVTCFGEDDGTITASATGGATITVDGVAYDPNATYGPGMYTVRAEAAGGNPGDICFDEEVVTISEPDEVTLTVSSTNVTCFGEDDGTITASATGGATITVDGVAYDPNATYGPGLYTVRAEAAGGNPGDICFDEEVITISEPDEVTLTASSTNVTCFGEDDGTITASATGGATITVDGVAYDPNATYGPGMYTVRAEAAGGNPGDICFDEEVVTISEPDEVTLTVSSTNVTCFGEDDGTITASATGGATITVDGVAYDPNATYGPGMYTVRAEAAGGNPGDICFDEEVVTISEPDEIYLTVVGDALDCNGDMDGTISGTVSGGSAPYTVTLSGAADASTTVNTDGGNYSFSGLAAGNYTVTVEDDNFDVAQGAGCSATADTEVTEPTAVSATLEAVCRVGTNDATINIDLTPSGGTGPYTFAWSGPGGQFTTEDLEGVPEGRYYVTVTDANLCTYNTNITQEGCCMLEELTLNLGVDLTSCLNGPTPPSMDDVPPARSNENLLAFLIIVGCVDEEDLMFSDEVTGPIVNGNEYTFIRTYTIEAWGVQAVESEMYTFEWDPNPPTLTGIPEDIKLPCGSEIPDFDGIVTGYDIEYGPVEVIENMSQVGRSCGGYAVLRTWTATDGCGNTTTGTQMITFEDDDPPVLTIPADTTIYCPGTIPVPYYDAYDACSQYNVDYSEEVIYLDNGCEYDIIRTWKARDACGNWVMESQTIQYRDTTPPTIEVVNPMLADIPVGGDMIMYGCMDPQVAMGDIVVTEECCDFEVELNDELIASDVCDVFGYYRHWRCSYTVTDAAGNVSEFYFNVLQYDTLAPTIYNVPADTMVACDSLIPAVDTTVYVEDNCSAEATPDFAERIIYDPEDSTKYAIIRTWSATDRCGNYTEVDQVIAVCDFDTTLISAEIGSTVWMDDNMNGLQDAEESGLNHVEVRLYSVNDNAIALVESTVTRTKNGLDGQFEFKYVLPGAYQVEFVIPSELYFTVPNMGKDDQLDSDVDPVLGMTDVYTIQMGDVANHIDAGLTTEEIEAFALLSFEVNTLEDCTSALTWTTMQGVTTDRFDIQRSTDGQVFEDLSVIKATGASAGPTLYSFIDHKSPSRAYYRLKIVDMDGSSTYSSTVRSLARSCAGVDPNLTLYPNPFKGQTTIEFDMPRSENILLTIVDQIGTQVKTKVIDSHRGINRQDLDLTDLPEGIYFLRFRVGNELFNHKLVKIQ